jgi:hypothetical protein
MKIRAYLWISVLLLTVLLGACSAPVQIAAYPKTTPIARFPIPPGEAPHAYIEVQVTSVDRAEEHAIRLAAAQGGYLSDSQSWYVSGQKAASLDLAVPPANFERLCSALLGLGDVISQTCPSWPAPAYYRDYPAPYAVITVQLRPIPPAWPPHSEPAGWNPLRTLQRAFGVFMTIFSFLIDILIWVLVVVGPFVLLGLGAWAVVRRMQR